MFADNLKRAMTERDMTQTLLSASSGIGKSSISQYLSGKNVPNDKAKKRLADALDVSVDYFNSQAVHLDPAPDNCGIKNVTVEQAAKLLGKSQQFVRVSLQRGIAPFGFAVKITGDKYSYHISPKKFYEYMNSVQ
jgi:transcriptional regulator with XRE-family HTH domain